MSIFVNLNGHSNRTHNHKLTEIWIENESRKGKESKKEKKHKSISKNIKTHVSIYTHGHTYVCERSHSFLLENIMVRVCVFCPIRMVFDCVCHSFLSVFTCWLNSFCAFILWVCRLFSSGVAFSICFSFVSSRLLDAHTRIKQQSCTHTWYKIDAVICPVSKRKSSESFSLSRSKAGLQSTKCQSVVFLFTYLSKLPLVWEWPISFYW